jgi:IrrE N-terminal-like domain
MGRDYKALHMWVEEDLARIALDVRRRAGYRDNELTFCAWEALGRLPFMRNVRVEFFDHSEKKDPAFVRFDPSIELHIAREIYQAAKEHDGYARSVILHEAAHVRLHNNGENSFSPYHEYDDKLHIKEWSVEWQANTWAGHFLLPDSIVRIYDDAEQIVEMCNVDTIMAKFRLQQFRDKTRRQSNRDICFHCGNLKSTDRLGRLFCKDCADRA